MLHKTRNIITALAVMILGQSAAHAAGVTYTSGNVSTTNAAIATTGNAVASVTLDLNIPGFFGLGVYSTGGTQANPLFTTANTTFATQTFTAAESSGILQNDEVNLSSKLALDGVGNLADAQIIINKIGQPNSATDDFRVKGVMYSTTTNGVSMQLSANSLTMTGGTGTAPVLDFRNIVGLPGGNVSTSTTPATALNIVPNRFNANSYSRFIVVGDVQETTIAPTTRGNWTGLFTITLTSL